MSGPLWFEKTSQFVRLLRSELEANGINANIVAFKWSGANSLLHRSDASYELSRLLQRQKREQPEAAQIVVGHSHGGTLCMLTLKNLPDDVQPIFVTLATPFMEIINSELTPSAQYIKALATKNELTPIILVIALMAAIHLLNEGYTSVAALANIIPGLASVIVFFLTLFLGTAKDGEGPDDLAWLRQVRLHPVDFETLTKGGATVSPPRDILVIRGVDDEAGFALAVGSLGARISSIGVEASVRVLRIISWSCVPIFLLLLLDFYSGGKVRLDEYAYPAFFPALAALVMFCLLPLISCILKSVYGRELALGGYFCDIKTGSAPDAISGIKMVTLPPGAARGLRHGIYHNENAPKAIADFIAQKAPLGATSR